MLINFNIKILRENVLIQVFQQVSQEMVIMLVQHIFFNLSDHLIPIIKQEFKESLAIKKIVALKQKQLQL